MILKEENRSTWSKVSPCATLSTKNLTLTAICAVFDLTFLILMSSAMTPVKYKS
jgi:hypothetical protein